jgi:hypothetical protein
MKFTPEQIIDAFYGPPKKEGQKKLEDFKKKKVPKPEKPKTMEQEITIKDKEGKETTISLEQLKEQWLNFYRNHHLEEMAQELEQTELTLTDEQIQRIQELAAKEGFNHFLLLPSPETQQQCLQRIKEETGKEIPGLPDKEQYASEGIWLSNTVFPDKIATLNRSTKPYLLFAKDEQEVDPETRNQTPDQLRQTFQQKNLTGLTLAEYLIFQREYTERNKKHPEDNYWTLLLDSELSPDSSGLGRVLFSHWSPDSRLVRVYSDAPGSHYPHFGARSSAIFEIL